MGLFMSAEVEPFTLSIVDRERGLAQSLRISLLEREMDDVKRAFNRNSTTLYTLGLRIETMIDKQDRQGWRNLAGFALVVGAVLGPKLATANVIEAMGKFFGL